jgi:hypothetical protein
MRTWGGRNLKTPRPGTALKRTGVALIAVGIIFNSASQTLNAFPRWLGFLSAHDIAANIYFAPWMQVLIPGGAFLIWRGRQYAAQANVKRIITDSKQHLLYLRAFRSDPSI